MLILLGMTTRLFGYAQHDSKRRIWHRAIAGNYFAPYPGEYLETYPQKAETLVKAISYTCL